MTMPLDGISVLIVEDEVIIGMMLLNEIERAGGMVIGPVTSAAQALKEIACEKLDVAIVDSKLADGSASDLAAAFEKRGIHYLVLSGYEQENLPESLRGAPFLAKPVAMPLLIEAIEGLVSRAAPAPDEPVDRVADEERQRASTANRPSSTGSAATGTAARGESA